MATFPEPNHVPDPPFDKFPASTLKLLRQVRHLGTVRLRRLGQNAPLGALQLLRPAVPKRPAQTPQRREPGSILHNASYFVPHLIPHLIPHFVHRTWRLVGIEVFSQQKPTNALSGMDEVSDEVRDEVVSKNVQTPGHGLLGEFVGSRHSSWILAILHWERSRSGHHPVTFRSR